MSLFLIQIMVKDPVCGMEVDEKKAAKVEYDGKTYFCCSPTCQWAFQSNPAQFLKGHGKMEM